MRKPPSFFVTTLSLLVFLSLACTACGRNTVYSSAGTAPAPARDPVTQVYALAWAPDGARLALGTKNGDIQVWNTRSKTLLLSAAQRFGEVYALAWSPDGKYLASGGQDQTVHLWNTTTGQQVFAYRSRFSTGEVLTLAWSPDGKELAEGLNVGIGQVWETTSHTLVAAFSNFTGEDEVTALSWSPDGKLLAEASTDRTVHIWGISTGSPPFAYRGHQDEVRSVMWSPNGSYLASGSLDGTVQVWDAQTGRTRVTYRGQSAGVWAISWSPDGNDIASASQDQTVQVWQAMAGKRLWTSRGDGAEVWAVSWSPDGQQIASVSAGGWSNSGMRQQASRSGCFTFREIQHGSVWFAQGRFCRTALQALQNFDPERKIRYLQHAHRDRAGRVRCRAFLLDGEQDLADERALVNLIEDVFTLEFQEQPRLLKNPSTDRVSLLSVLRSCSKCSW